MARRAEEQTVVVVGAGLVGAMTAVLLGRRGYRVKVYEGRADPRSHPSECAGAGGADVPDGRGVPVVAGRVVRRVGLGGARPGGAGASGRGLWDTR